MQGGLTVLPQVNLVTNIGFGHDATHTQKRTDCSALPTESLSDLTHPKWMTRDGAADLFTDDHVFSGAGRRGPVKRIENAIRKLRRAA
jgi:hypothetical protein